MGDACQLDGGADNRAGGTENIGGSAETEDATIDDDEGRARSEDEEAGGSEEDEAQSEQEMDSDLSVSSDELFCDCRASGPASPDAPWFLMVLLSRFILCKRRLVMTVALTRVTFWVLLLSIFWVTGCSKQNTTTSEMVDALVVDCRNDNVGCTTPFECLADDDEGPETLRKISPPLIVTMRKMSRAAIERW